MTWTQHPTNLLSLSHTLSLSLALPFRCPSLTQNSHQIGCITQQWNPCFFCSNVLMKSCVCEDNENHIQHDVLHFIINENASNQWWQTAQRCVNVTLQSVHLEYSQYCHSQSYKDLFHKINSSCRGGQFASPGPCKADFGLFMFFVSSTNRRKIPTPYWVSQSKVFHLVYMFKMIDLHSTAKHLHAVIIVQSSECNHLLYYTQQLRWSKGWEPGKKKESTTQLM